MASFIDFSLEKHCFKLLEGILVTSKEDTTPPPLAYIIEIILPLFIFYSYMGEETRGDNEPDKLASSSGSAQSKLGQSSAR